MSHNQNSYTYSGGCHCKRVRWNLMLKTAIKDFEIIACNCSMCEKFAYLHIIVPKQNLEIESCADSLSNYQFNKKIAKHYFCKICGVKSFYVPRSNPNGVSMNANCIDDLSTNLFVLCVISNLLSKIKIQYQFTN